MGALLLPTGKFCRLSVFYNTRPKGRQRLRRRPKASEGAGGAWGAEGAGARIREFDSEELIDSGPGPGHWANFGHTQRSLR